MRSILWGVIIVSSFTVHAFGQSQEPVSIPGQWFLADPGSDHEQGVSADKAYAILLAGQPSKPVIVAVIDTGVDPEHEDLRDILWTNPGEIAGNGIDDDHNGYVDDIHGWNFLGNKTTNVQYDTYELTREVMRLRDKFAGVEESAVPRKQKEEFGRYKKLRTKYEKLKAKNQDEFDVYSKLYSSLAFCLDTLQQVLHTDSITSENLASFQPATPLLSSIREYLTGVLDKLGDGGSLNTFLKQIREGYDYYGVIVNYGYNQDYDSRKIIGDHYADMSEKFYGNNDVKGPDALHGTHVAGLIGANRKNDIGIRGVADNVRIMAVRAVPNGDERDKDIANAIRYATDNGARIINMSFGKSFSPEKETVDQAVKYAEDKGVLLIHAAGNDGDDNDTEPNFPTDRLSNGKEIRNWIEVGASGSGADQQLAAGFSNYGKKTVDLFAPGVELYSTVPENKYASESGTSMASPVAAGVAAILMSYFPDLTASEVKSILMQSVRHFDNLKVGTGGSKKKSDFGSLSVSGGIINAYDAVKLAQEMKKKTGSR